MYEAIKLRMKPIADKIRIVQVATEKDKDLFSTGDEQFKTFSIISVQFSSNCCTIFEAVSKIKKNMKLNYLKQNISLENHTKDK